MLTRTLRSIVTDHYLLDHIQAQLVLLYMALLISFKRQATSSLTAGVGYDRMYLERNKHMSDKTNEEQLKVLQITELRRIADALDTVIKMVKEDQERSKKYMEDRKDD